MNTDSFLLYGANGYTGELIARFAKDYGLTPVLAGRTKANIEPLANKLGYSFLVFDLNDEPALINALKEFKVVVNCAGPFQFTAKQMIEACLKTRTHYIDINGDISVFEMIRRFDDAAQKAGIMLLPGAGFDVVPTDCLALKLKKQMPDAVQLQLAFATLGGSLSHGTAMTMVSKLGEGGAIRRNGKINRQPLGKLKLMVPFKMPDGSIKKKFVMSIPWGDVATSYYTTGIPNMESYTGVPKKLYYMLKVQGLFNWLLRKNFFRNIARKKINKRGPGPTDEQRSRALSLIWGCVLNDKGEFIEESFSCPDGYTLSMYSCLIITKKILNGDFKIGFQTPGLAYGEELLSEIPNTTPPSPPKGGN